MKFQRITALVFAGIILRVSKGSRLRLRDAVSSNLVVASSSLSNDGAEVDELLSGVETLLENVAAYQDAVTGGFFDQEDLNEAAAFLSDNMQDFIYYTMIPNSATNLGEDALFALNLLSTRINNAVFSVESFARNLRSVSQSTVSVFEQMVEMDTFWTNEEVLEYSLRLYIDTLDVSIEAATAAQNELALVPVQGDDVHRKLALAQNAFAEAQNEESLVYQALKARVRTEAYVTCGVVCVVTVAVACLPCFAAAVPIVEAWLIPEATATFRELEATLDGFTSSLDTFQQLTSAYVASAIEKRDALNIFVTDLAGPRQLIGGFQNPDTGEISTFLAGLFYEQTLKSLIQTVDSCDALLESFNAVASGESSLLQQQIGQSESSSKAVAKSSSSRNEKKLRNEADAKKALGDLRRTFHVVGSNTTQAELEDVVKMAKGISDKYIDDHPEIKTLGWGSFSESIVPSGREISNGFYGVFFV